MKVVAHNYQPGAVQEIADFVYGTTGIIRHGADFIDEKVLMCGVLYMAEDIWIMAQGKARVFIPQIEVQGDTIRRPRCPMISGIGSSDPVMVSHIEQARKENPDLVLTYINTPAPMKARSDGVYNGTLAVQIVGSIAEKSGGKGSVAFVGDVRTNHWIQTVIGKRYPDFHILSVPFEGVHCPSHLQIKAKPFIEKHRELQAKYGAENVGLALHAEVDEELMMFGLQNDAYFGGTGGLVKTPKNSEKPVWLVGTVEGVIDRLKRESDKEIHSPGIYCPNMSFTTPASVLAAKEIIEEVGPVASIHLARESRPYYDIEILRPELVSKTISGIKKVPAVELTIDESIAKGARKALSTLL